jgi:hypothetical protein
LKTINKLCGWWFQGNCRGSCHVGNFLFRFSPLFVWIEMAIDRSSRDAEQTGGHWLVPAGMRKSDRRLPDVSNSRHGIPIFECQRGRDSANPAITCGKTESGTVSPLVKTTACSTVFSSCRTFPGQS